MRSRTGPHKTTASDPTTARHHRGTSSDRGALLGSSRHRTCQSQRVVCLDKAERLARSAGSLHIRCSRNTQNLPEKRLRLPAFMEWQSWGSQTPICCTMMSLGRIWQALYVLVGIITTMRGLTTAIEEVAHECRIENNKLPKKIPRPRQHEREPDDSDL